MPDAEIIAVGSELLTPQKIDTNSLYLTDQLNALGVEVVRKKIVGDHSPRDSVAAALGRELIFNQEVCGWIEQRFRSFGRIMAENNKRQAYIVDGAVILGNQWGTAPGQWIASNGGVVIL